MHSQGILQAYQQVHLQFNPAFKLRYVAALESRIR
jgi:hypothetical protein